MPAEERHYLCFACGHIGPADHFKPFVVADLNEGLEGGWAPAPPGSSDPMLLCPLCKWQHQDDDSNPGLADGTYVECFNELCRVVNDYREAWDERLTASGRGTDLGTALEGPTSGRTETPDE